MSDLGQKFVAMAASGNGSEAEKRIDQTDAKEHKNRVVTRLCRGKCGIDTPHFVRNGYY